MALTALLAIATIVPVATPSGAQSPTAVPENVTLKEIGRVRVTSPLCKTLVGDAVSAIGIETENGRRLAETESVLRGVDLDKDQIAKHRGTNDLTKRFVDLRASAVAGNSILQRFRIEAKTAPTGEQRASLLLFADALDGALHRQKVLADDLGRFVAYLDTHEPIDKDAHDALIFNAILNQNDGRYPHTAFDQRDFGPFATVPDSLSSTAKNAAAEIERRAMPIAGDEEAAAARVEPAFDRC